MTAGAGRPVIFGEVLFDRFPDGSNVLGGAPFNVAWHLQAFGLAPLFVSRVGDDGLGRGIRGAMLDWGMDLAGLQLDSGHPTGTVEVTLQHGEPVFEIIDDRAYDHIQAHTLPPVEAALLYHGTLAVRNPASRASLQALRRDLAVPVMLDVNLRPPWWERADVESLLAHADQVKLNQDELRLLVPDAGEPTAAAQQMQRRYTLDRVIITRGREGALALDQDGTPHQAPPVPAAGVVDTVGAGDAFTSVAILGTLRGWPLARILERAQAFAAAVVGIRGATTTAREFYRPFIDQWGAT